MDIKQPDLAAGNIYAMEKTLFDLLVWLWISVAVVLLIVLLFITAPFVRHS